MSSDVIHYNSGCCLQDNRVHIGPKIEMRVVTLGLDGSGKTSILFKLKQNEFIPTIATIGIVYFSFWVFFFLSFFLVFFLVC